MAAAPSSPTDSTTSATSDLDQREAARRMRASTSARMPRRACVASRARPLWLITMARGGAMPRSSQIVRVAVLAASAVGPEAQRRARDARTTTPAGRACAASTGGRPPASRNAAPARGRRGGGEAIAGRVARAEHARPRFEDGAAAGLLQAGQQLEVAVRTAAARRLGRKPGAARPARMATTAEPEHSSMQGDAPASMLSAWADSVAPEVAPAALQNRCVCGVSHCWRDFGAYTRGPCQCRTSIRA